MILSQIILNHCSDIHFLLIRTPEHSQHASPCYMARLGVQFGKPVPRADGSASCMLPWISQVTHLHYTSCVPWGIFWSAEQWPELWSCWAMRGICGTRQFPSCISHQDVMLLVLGWLRESSTLLPLDSYPCEKDLLKTLLHVSEKYTVTYSQTMIWNFISIHFFLK